MRHMQVTLWMYTSMLEVVCGVKQKGFHCYPMIPNGDGNKHGRVCSCCIMSGVCQGPGMHLDDPQRQRDVCAAVADVAAARMEGHHRLDLQAVLACLLEQLRADQPWTLSMRGAA